MKKSEQTVHMRERLLEFHVHERQERLLGAVLRYIEDPLKPRTAEGGFRPNPFLLLLAILAALAAGGFLIFSFVQS